MAMKANWRMCPPSSDQITPMVADWYGGDGHECRTPTAQTQKPPVSTEIESLAARLAWRADPL
jgi:hypothetical protein